MPDDIKLDAAPEAAAVAAVVDKVQSALVEELGLDLEADLTPKVGVTGQTRAAMLTLKDAVNQLLLLKGLGDKQRYCLYKFGVPLDRQDYADANDAAIAAIQTAITADGSIDLLDAASGNILFTVPPGGFNR